VSGIRRRRPTAETYRVKNRLFISSKYCHQTDIPYKKYNLHRMQRVEIKTKDVPQGIPLNS
jgi:hypothetical protein